MNGPGSFVEIDAVLPFAGNLDYLQNYDLQNLGNFWYDALKLVQPDRNRRLLF